MIEPSSTDIKVFPPIVNEGKLVKAAETVRKLAYIDSLRGVAILMVILVHTSQTIPGLSKFSRLIADFGQMGVQLFFILSAYTICLSLDKGKDKQRFFSSFYIKRYFRIAPLYYCGILLYFVLNFYSGFNVDYSFKNVLANVLFYHGFYEPANNYIVFGGWSIGTEMAFYAIVPFLFLGISKYCKNKFVIVLIPFMGILISVLGFMVISSVYEGAVVKNSNFLYYNLLNQLPVFLLGISYYFAEKNSIFKIKDSSFAYFLIFLIITTLSLYLFYIEFNFTIIPFITGIGFIFLVKTFKYNNKINFSILQRVGQLSYSMYIFHFLFAWFATRLLEKHLLAKIFLPEVSLLICFVMSCVMTALVAVISEKTIERRGIQMGKALLMHQDNKRLANRPL